MYLLFVMRHSLFEKLDMVYVLHIIGSTVQSGERKKEYEVYPLFFFEAMNGLDLSFENYILSLETTCGFRVDIFNNNKVEMINVMR